MAFFDNFLVYFLIVIINVSSINGQKVIKSKNEAQCPYDNSDILGAIVASVIVTIIITGLTLFIVWILWKKDYLNLGEFYFFNIFLIFLFIFSIIYLILFEFVLKFTNFVSNCINSLS